ncbi:MAG: T9SS type A sorting domain-containing protein [Candidatus Cloacimonadota bacterium]|nr:T9SS type A sorting domain-containing protein [Candidatus Cloacimonadota bacterium]
MTKNSLIIGFILITLFSTTLFGQLNQPNMKYYPIETEIRNINTRYDTIPAPEWEFISLPTELMTSYYDYMPGGYTPYSLRWQDEGNGNGLYGIFHAQSSTTSNRRMYWFYIYSDSTIFVPEIITSPPYYGWQGYGSIDILNIINSGNPVVSWHECWDEISVTPITYDDFDLNIFPGFWAPPYYIPSSDTLGNEFLGPQVFVGNSPLGDGYARVYVLRTNIGIIYGNVQIIYKDIQNPEEIIQPGWLNNQITNENGDPMFTDWCEQDIIPYWSFAIDKQNPGRIAFIGYAAYLEVPPNPPVEEGFFVYESLDYGETWTLYDFGMPPAIENLLQFQHPPGNVPDSIEVLILGFHNTALFDGEGNLHWCYTGGYGFTYPTGYCYLTHFISACEMVWFGDDIVEWRNVWPPVPWEIDENGDTLVHYSHAVSGYDGGGLIFHENGQKQATNLDNNWMVQVWADGTYLMFAEDGDTAYQDYLEHPIIFVSASKDNGEHWTEPIELTDIYSQVFPGFANQITVYPYICDQIVDLGDGWGQVYMYYFDDNDYGSYLQGQGPPTGGQITYCSFKINFGDIVAVDEEQEMPSPEILLYNYPNPVKNTTTISFLTTKNTKDTKIRIYNVKGQLVKQFKIQNSKFKINKVEWDVRDGNGRELPNGIYLYQLNCGNQSITKKMILLR